MSNPIFHSTYERFPKTPGTVMACRNVCKYIGRLANEGDCILFPRMSKVSDNHSQGREIDGYVLEREGRGVTNPCTCRKRSSLMPHYRNRKLRATSKERPMFPVGRIEMLIGRPKLQTAQTKARIAVIQLVHTVG